MKDPLSGTVKDPMLETKASQDAYGLDITRLARSLGSPFAGNAVQLAASGSGQGRSGQTMQAVLTSTLVKEYLRCADELKKYQKRHGILPNAPTCNAEFAEALLTGLRGSDVGSTPS